jgi:hypothetical protein
MIDALITRQPGVTTRMCRECERSWVPVEPPLQNRRGSRVKPLIRACDESPPDVALLQLPAANRWR